MFCIQSVAGKFESLTVQLCCTDIEVITNILGYRACNRLFTELASRFGTRILSFIIYGITTYQILTMYLDKETHPKIRNLQQNMVDTTI
jgi:hypothetical protein